MFVACFLRFAGSFRRNLLPCAAGERRLRVGVGLLLTGLAGCANPGPPRPPSLHLPELATQLTARRVGDEVEVTWMTAAGTSDGGSLRGPITAVLCRQTRLLAGETAPGRASATTCMEQVHRGAVHPGLSSASERIPRALAEGPPTLLTYRVELMNDRGRSAGLSAPVYAAGGVAPAPAGPLEGSKRRNALLITWQPGSGGAAAPMQMQRTLDATAAGPYVAEKASGKARPGLSSKAQETAGVVTLAAELPGPGVEGSDPGGMVDGSVHDGDTVTYVGQRVLSVKLAVPATEVLDKKGNLKPAAASVETFELRGEASPPMTMTFHDTIPPDPPAGVAAIAGGGFGEAPSIDLSWEPNAESDLLGYDVYRADAGPKPQFRRLNAEPVRGADFRDPTAQPNQSYIYQVTAVDVRHNESAPSAPVMERLRP